MSNRHLVASAPAPALESVTDGACRGAGTCCGAQMACAALALGPGSPRLLEARRAMHARGVSGACPPPEHMALQVLGSSALATSWALACTPPACASSMATSAARACEEMAQSAEVRRAAERGAAAVARAKALESWESGKGILEPDAVRRAEADASAAAAETVRRACAARDGGALTSAGPCGGSASCGAAAELVRPS